MIVAKTGRGASAQAKESWPARSASCDPSIHLLEQGRANGDAALKTTCTLRSLNMIESAMRRWPVRSRVASDEGRELKLFSESGLALAVFARSQWRSVVFERPPELHCRSDC